ncbi:MAG: hypothetical protein IKQ41_11575 [Clostridia bacterium]|nr:hypothetical protein [Clostridia bacterium]
MKKLFALLLVLCLLCASAFALADISMNNLGWEATDDEHMVVTDEIREKVEKALKGFKDGKVEPFLVLATQHASATGADTGMDSASKSKLDDSLADLLKSMGADPKSVTTTYIHGDDLCVLCRVTPKGKNVSMYWIMAFISYEGELLHTVKLETEYVR